MREIKFRGLMRGKWHFWNIKDVIIAPFETKNNDEFWNTVGQFTGLKDKNGKEIYEGDIVKVSELQYANIDEMQVAQAHHFEVVWSDSKAGYEIKLVSSEAPLIESKFFDFSITTAMNFEVEVIGNIYENPELLK